MLTLVIETATAACSVALLRGGEVVASAHEVVGRGHAERLVPMIAALPDQGRAPRILVDVGPGSFTGVRVGLAAALGLAIGWQAEIHGYSSLALLAATGFAESPQCPALAAILEGGHGEVFMQSFTASPLTPEGPLQSLVPAAALAALGQRPAIGSGVRHLAALDPGRALTEALPRAEDARLLASDLASLPPRPIYGRAPDAKTLAERGLA
ncbi:tRNA (adenosine(37)-N6)-threonylcarbamoyltransferase complex dimerization subunit type 1 TsaB [Sphingomonas psychrotolerans]|uniref:tRNA (Adenosine(37)-N6)-threonylcarbamoyltransferase complex dimerization subunit type 1 TsaB n=1 Tax=Sphingomonas psychrotolerans TaxID=1327635 RepID=A0A2K8MNN4_9SPHN|nr:tRNA (adenosine(37)-N6)-threonylcarbamoyltransferase complex dimerization subunit type 1 TsaB [Sphingomonas psychrotolerans]ATY33589.1 tRNA (adenosine(37)-N6)-threonylcarbamoyltransferase complex dimerization subunit type 1 TsaB [Sphingomonas psychrotolerans]